MLQNETATVVGGLNACVYCDIGFMKNNERTCPAYDLPDPDWAVEGSKSAGDYGSRSVEFDVSGLDP